MEHMDRRQAGMHGLWNLSGAEGLFASHVALCPSHLYVHNECTAIIQAVSKDRHAESCSEGTWPTLLVFAIAHEYVSWNSTASIRSLIYSHEPDGL